MILILLEAFHPQTTGTLTLTRLYHFVRKYKGRSRSHMNIQTVLYISGQTGVCTKWIQPVGEEDQIR